MTVGVLRLEIVLHAALSLKEKRGVVQSLLGRIRSRFPVSAAETGLHDLWQRSEIGVCMVSNDRELLRRVFAGIEEEIEKSGSAEIVERFVEMIDY